MSALRAPWFRAGLGLLVSGVLVGLLVREVPPAEVGQALVGARLPLLVGAAVVHGIMLLLRIQRFAGLVGEAGVASRAAFDAVFVGWLSNLALPAKAGELARPVAYAAWSGATLPKVVGALLVERALDLLLLGALFALALGLGLPSALPGWVEHVGWAAGGLAMIALAGFAVVLRSVSPGRDDVLGQFRDGLLGMGPAPLARALGWSAGIWALEVVGVLLTFAALGIDASGAVAAAAVLVVASTLAVVPTAAPGGLGVEQWAAVLVLGAWSVSRADAVAVSLLVLLQAVVWIAPLGVLALGRRAASSGLERAE